MNGPFSLWLEPDVESGAALSSVIARLAWAHGTPSFRPHVTVAGRIALPAQRIAACAEDLITAGAVSASFTSIGMDEVVVRALHLQPGDPADFASMRKAAVCALDLPEESYDPHLSLMYTDAYSEVRERIAPALRLALPYAATFDLLTLWHTPEGRFEEWAEVGRWLLDSEVRRRKGVAGLHLA